MQEVWQLINSGRLADAEAACLSTLKVTPQLGEAEFALGVIAYRRGNSDLALGQIRKVLTQDARIFSALTLGARIFFERRDFERALEFSQRAHEINPLDPMVLSVIGRCLLALGSRLEALQAFDALVRLDPKQATGYYGIADTFLALGSSFDAVEALRNAVRLAPDKARLQKLADLELTLGRPLEALKAAARVLNDDANSISANIAAGRSLTELGKQDQAAPYWAAAKQGTPDKWRVDRQEAYALSMAGKFLDSEFCLERSISAEPKQGAAYHLLFTGRKASEADRDRIDSMEALADGGLLEASEAIPLHFALGKAWDDLDNPERAIRFFDRANEMQLKSIASFRPFSSEALEEQFALHRELFPSKDIAAGTQTGRPPIFVVGMMRTGTTLVEQILAAHPEVAGAGEQDFWTGSESLIVDRLNRQIRADLVPERRAAYIRLVHSFGGDELSVVDKNPANLVVAGLIHSVFPDSPIIHLRRNPVDTALSIWMTYMQTFAPFMADRGNISFAIKQADRQADYWAKVLPKDRFLSIRYEDLVEDPEKLTRSILEFCGLPWHDSCLKSPGSGKSVKTPSLWQVRQPIYKSSVARWKRYEPWLGEFRQLLEAG
jgi:tetratricopeptide (TPR) repeat protein